MALNRDLLAALGLIAYNFQNFEKQIEFLAWCLIGGDQAIGQIVTSQIPFARLCDLLGSLFRYRTNDAELIAELDDLLAKAANIEQDKNIIMHSAWAVANGPKAVVTRFKITARRDKGIKHQFQSMEASDLSKIASSVRKAANEFSAFMKKAKDKGIINFPSGQIKSPRA